MGTIRHARPLCARRDKPTSRAGPGCATRLWPRRSDPTPAAARLPHSRHAGPGLPARRSSAAARAAASPGGTRKPVWPSTTCSARATTSRRHDRQAGQHGLDHRHRQAFESAGQGEDVGCGQERRNVGAVAQQRKRRRGPRRAARRQIGAPVARQALADHPKLGVRHVAHGGQRVRDSPCAAPGARRRRSRPGRRDPQCGADPGAGRRVRVEDGRVAPVADRLGGAAMCRRRASAASSSDTVRNTSVTRAASHSIAEGGGPARQGDRLVEQEAMTGIGDPRHARDTGGQAAEEAADRHMGMHQIRALAPQQGDQRAEGPPLRQRGQAADEGVRTRRGSPRRARRPAADLRRRAPTTSCPRARMPRISGSRKCLSEKSTLITSTIFIARRSADLGQRPLHLLRPVA